MTITYVGSEIHGLSTDTKPPLSTTGKIFIETDSGDRFIFNGTIWVYLTFSDKEWSGEHDAVLTNLDNLGNLESRAIIFGDNTIQEGAGIPSSISSIISTGIFNQSKDVSTEDNIPSSVCFRPNGATMFVLGDQNSLVYEYALSTIWNVSAASFTTNTFSVAAQDTTPTGMFIRNDGRKMYIAGQQNSKIYEYDLSTPFDITTASFSGNEFSVIGQDASPRGLRLSPDGLKAYIGGSATNSVYAYDLTTQWDISTAVYNGETFDMSSFGMATTGIFVPPNGKKLYVLVFSIIPSFSKVTEFNLVEPGDISTAEFTVELDITANDNGANDLFLRDDLGKFYVAGAENDDILEFDLGTTLTGASIITDFTNANHTHLDIAQGGTLTAAAITDFQSTVSLNADVVANTAKVTNQTHTGAVTGSVALTITDDAVTYAKIQDVVANNVLLGNNSGTNQIVDELTGTQVTALLDLFGVSKGLVPPNGGGSSAEYLSADGTFSVPAGTGIETLAGDSAINQTLTAGTGINIVNLSPDHEFSIDSTVVTLTGIQTLTNKTLTTPTITDLHIPAPTTGFDYVIKSSEIIAEREITLPLLGEGDVFVFEGVAQTLTNKTYTLPIIGDFTQATHDHSNPVGGGQLTNTALTSGVFSSITGLGVQSQALDMGNNDIINSGKIEMRDANDLFDYIITTSALVLDRTITLPALIANDDFVFANHIQTLSNKTLITPTIASFENANHDHSDLTGGGQLLSTTALSDTANIAYVNTVNTFAEDQTFDKNINLVGGNFLQTPLDPTFAGSVIDPTNLNDPQDVCVVGNYAYVTGEDSDTFNIIDVTDPTAPETVSTLTNAVLLDGARGVYVSGQYAFVVASNTDRLTVIDISDPTVPVIVGDLADSTTMNQPRSVYVVGNYAYVSGSISHSLAVVDIRDPTNPILVGSLIDATNMNRASFVYVDGNYAYVTGEVGNSLAVVDISNPTAPTLTGVLINAIDLLSPRAVYVSGRYAYVISFAGDSLAIIDISDPTTPTLASSLIDSSNLDAASGVRVAGNYAYVTGGQAINILDVSDPTITPTIVGRLVDGTNMNGPAGIFVSGKYAYVTARTSDSLAVIDISGINAPSATIGSVEAGFLAVTDNAVIANDLYANSLTAGVGGISWDNIPVSRAGLTTHEIFSAADFPAAVAGVITLPTGHYSIKNSVTLTDRIEFETDANVIIDSDDSLNNPLVYVGTGTLFTATDAGIISIRFVSIILTNSLATYADITTGSFGHLNANINFVGGGGTLGTVTNTDFFLMDNCGVNGFSVGFTYTATAGEAVLAIQNSSFSSPALTTPTFFTIDNIGASGTFINLTMIALGFGSTIFDFDSGITKPINITRVVNVIPTLAAFFAVGSLDNTDPNVSVQDSSAPDSMTTGEFDFLNIATPQLITIVTQDVPVAIAGGAWSDTQLERITADVGNNGIATLTALGTQDYVVTFSALLEKLTGGSTNIALTVLINGTDTTTNPPRSVNAGIIQINGSRIFSLTTDDTLQLAVFNTDDTNNIEVSQATMSITRSG